MRTFLIRITKFVLPILLSLYIVGLGMEYMLYRNTRELFYTFQADWHLYHPKKMQALFIGNSRTGVHVDMPYLTKAYDVPMYAICQDARRLDILWWKFKKYLERNPKPKAIVLQMDVSTLIDEGLNQNTMYGKEKLLTYFFANQLGINHLFEKEVGYHWYETVIPLIRYIPYPEYFDMYWHKKFADPYAPPANYGVRLIPYDPKNILPPIDSVSAQVEPKKAIEIPKLNMAYVDTFANYCRQHHIQLIGVFPPYTAASYKASQYYKTGDDIAQYARKRGIMFRNFNTDTYLSDSLFFNHMHLNDRGAAIYTRELKMFLDSIGFAQWVKPETLERN